MRIALGQDTLTVLADQGLRGTRAASTPPRPHRFWPTVNLGTTTRDPKRCRSRASQVHGWAGGFRADKDQFLGLAQQPHLVVLHGDDVVEVGEVSRGQIQDLLLAGGQPGLKPGNPARLRLGQELGEAAEQLGDHHRVLLSPAGSACGHRPPVPRVLPPAALAGEDHASDLERRPRTGRPHQGHPQPARRGCCHG